MRFFYPLSLTIFISLSLYAPQKSFSSNVENLIDELESKQAQVDTDGDGRVDLWRAFDKNGKILTLNSDDDGDGKPDLWTVFSPNKIVTLRDTESNGNRDWRKTEILNNNGQMIQQTIETKKKESWQTEEEWELVENPKNPKKPMYRVKRFVAGKVEIDYEPANLK